MTPKQIYESIQDVRKVILRQHIDNMSINDKKLVVFVEIDNVLVEIAKAIKNLKKLD